MNKGKGANEKVKFPMRRVIRENVGFHLPPYP